jgi:hypothetical protein
LTIVVLYIHNLLKTTFWEKVGPKHNLLGKGWTKTQPFKKRLDQKLQPMEKKVGPKHNHDLTMN